MADRSVSRILSCVRPTFGLHAGTIIPLGPDSHRDSCSLPEGHLPSREARQGTGRTSPPLLFGLAPRGVYRASTVAARAVGSYPTFSPLPHASRRIRTAHGFAIDRSPCGTRRRYFLCGTFRSRSLASATPWRYQARCPAESGLSSRPPGFPGRPAIVRPARRLQYTAKLLLALGPEWGAIPKVKLKLGRLPLFHVARGHRQIDHKFSLLKNLVPKFHCRTHLS